MTDSEQQTDTMGRGDLHARVMVLVHDTSSELRADKKLHLVMLQWE